MKANVKVNCRLLFILTFTVLLTIGSSEMVYGKSGHSGARKLRVAEPLDDVIADLQTFIPAYMAAEGVPGVSVALIRDHQLVWAEGFGVANAITRRPVSTDTTFKVASNSKVVTAYIALQLVDQGLISLDEPLDDYLPEPSMPQAEYRDAVTLRRVLSHTSGMGHDSVSREVLFHPGAGYSYSANGFLFAQDVAESVTGKGLAELADEMVFAPLGMRHSSFESTSAVMADPASGHLPGVIVGLLFGVPFALALLLVGGIGIVLSRLRSGRWGLSRRAALFIYMIAFSLACLPIAILSAGFGMWDYGLVVGLWGLVIAGFLVLAWVFGRRLISRLFPSRRGLQMISTAIWMLLSILALSAAMISWENLPVPGRAPVRSNAAGTVRATASDMALFLIEISDPQGLSPEMGAELAEPQVALHRDLSWGLGPGIMHTPEGNALWQWGQAPDFQSVMIIYPEIGCGVVVLANSDFFNPDVAIDIAQRALGGRIEAIRRASHLEFNYSGPFLEE
jgi:CubicO group peptidase (beta-lactamase class C family)